jgi:hypothetical protein
MASEIQIMNMALIKLGADSITSRTDNKNSARVMNSIYEMVRDAELRRHRWRFAIRRASLAALTDSPLTGPFALQYQLPVDCLRVLAVGDDYPSADLSDYRTQSSSEFSVESQKILTNFPAPLSLRYTARISDTGVFDPAFTEALASRLAMSGCERITNDKPARQLALADYRMAIKEAITANALENPPESFADDTWVIARAC